MDAVLYFRRVAVLCVWVPARRNILAPQSSQSEEMVSKTWWARALFHLS